MWVDTLGMDLTKEQWELVAPHIPEPKAKPGESGRPPRDSRDVLNGILWILRTGAPWKDLPERYPPKSTCHRRFQEWRASGVFSEILTTLAEDLRERGGLDFREGFIDGTFAPAKKGALAWARPNAAKAPKSWALQTLKVFLSPLTQAALAPTK